MVITHRTIVVFGLKGWFAIYKTPLTHVVQAVKGWNPSVQVFNEVLNYFKTPLHVCNHSLNYFKVEMCMTQWDDEPLQNENRLLTRWWWTATKYIHIKCLSTDGFKYSKSFISVHHTIIRFLSSLDKIGGYSAWKMQIRRLFILFCTRFALSLSANYRY